MNNKNTKLKNISKIQKFLLLLVIVLFLIICLLIIIVFDEYRKKQKGYFPKNIKNIEFSQNTKGICGPKGMGDNYDLSYCNKICDTSSDCKFTCGCGAINKDEICHDIGVKYDCVDHYTKCENGKCDYGEEKIRTEEHQEKLNTPDATLKKVAGYLRDGNIEEALKYINPGDESTVRSFTTVQRNNLANWLENAEEVPAEGNDDYKIFRYYYGEGKENYMELAVSRLEDRKWIISNW